MSTSKTLFRQFRNLSFLECQQDPLQSFRKSTMDWFRLRNTLNCFDWWYMKCEHRHSGWVQLRFQSCFRIGICSPRNRVDLRFWVASRLDSFTLTRCLEWRSFPEANCFLWVMRGITPLFEVRITSLAFNEGAYSLFRSSINFVYIYEGTVFPFSMLSNKML